MYIVVFFLAFNFLIAQTASVSGKIALPADAFQKEIKRRTRVKSYRPADLELEKKGKKYTEFEKTLVWLEPLDEANNVFIKKNGVLNQQFITFDPAHVVVQKGNEVIFINQDKIFHNVFSSCCDEKFDIGKKRTGEEVYVKFNKSEHLQVFCDIHSQMSALISVVESPYFTTCDSLGSFKISNVPAGQYIIHGWHPKAVFESGKTALVKDQALKVKLDFN